MKKLLAFGLLAAMFIIGLAGAASAQEEPPTEQPINTVDCTMLNFTPPEWQNANGNFVVGTPITLELYVPKGGEMEWFFVASRDGGAEYRLNDVSLQSIGWTPIEVGVYTVRGEFIDPEGNVLPVEDPSMCMVALTVDAAEVDPNPNPNPTPDPEPQPCSDPNTLITVPNDDGSVNVYDGDVLCGTVAPKPPVPNDVVVRGSSTPAPELARTGVGTTKLIILGAILVIFGLGVEWGGKKLATR